MTTTNEILAAAMSLSPEARAQIAEELLESLDPARDAVDAAWVTEIESRIREVEDRRAELIPHNDAMNLVHLRRKAGYWQNRED